MKIILDQPFPVTALLRESGAFAGLPFDPEILYKMVQNAEKLVIEASKKEKQP